MTTCLCATLWLPAGFGRIGRLVLRNALKRKDIEVVAVNGERVPFRGHMGG